MRHPEGLVVIGPLAFGRRDRALFEGPGVVWEGWGEVYRAQEHVDVVKVAVPGGTCRLRRFSWSTNSENFVKSSPGCWKAKNNCTWNPNDSYCCTGPTPSGHPSTTVAPARASASTALDSSAVTSLETGACLWSSTTPT